MSTLKTDRLVLRPFAFTDAEGLHRIRGDAQAMAFWDWPADATIDETKAVARSMLKDVASGAAQIWTIERATDATFVGVIDLTALAPDEADLGFMIRRDCWGRGFASEAANAVIAMAWREGLSRITARIHAGNVSSRQLLFRLGFAAGEVRDVEIRPAVIRACEYFSLARP